MDINTLLRKLKPLLPDQVGKWQRALPLVDRDVRAMLERHIIATAQRHLGDVSDRLLLPPPPKHTARGTITLGTVIYEKEKWPFGLGKPELLQNLAIFGRSGAGKTNIVFHLLHQLAAHQVPFLFLDWKRTVRHLLPTFPQRVNLYTPGRALAPLVFNPLIPPPGLEHHLYINHLVDLIASAYTLGDGAKSILQQALAVCYHKKGDWPTMRDLLYEVERQEAKGRAHGWKMSALRAIQSLTFANLVNTTGGYDQEALVRTFLEENTVVELDGLNENAKRFLIPTLLLWLYHLRLAAPDREQLRLVVVVEEAHHVLYRQEHRAQESALDRIFRQCRELGMSMVVVDQHPHLISSAALGNTYCSICLNLKDPSDVNRAAALSLLTGEEKDYLTQLPVGVGVVKLQDRWRRPFLVRFPLVVVKKGAVTDERLRALLRHKKTGSALKRQGREYGRDVQGVHVSALGAGGDACAFLEDVVSYPDDGVKARYQRLGMSVGRGDKVKRRLLEAGILEGAEVRFRRGSKVLLRPTPTARTSLGLEVKQPRHGSIPHEFWKQYYASRFEDQGYHVRLEAPRQGGYVDVLAEKDDERIAIEIETGKSDVVQNVRHNLASRFSRVIVVGTDEKALQRVRGQLARAELLTSEIVQLRLRDQRCPS